VDVNIIMGTGEGLLTPVIKDVAGKGLRAISNEISSFEDSLFTDKEGATIDYSKMSIGTFSIHNLGKWLLLLSL
jgi:pyruvate/2-oxoglutarate dehydrogenase complex dihydrolipoamide acyltransferase (E2) component